MNGSNNQTIQSERVNEVFAYFETLFGSDPVTELKYENDLQCIIAIILSAQCTDARVNMVTPKLFARFKTLEDFAGADIKELEKLIYSTGFYRNKAANIKAMAQMVLTRNGGQIPTSLDELVLMPGVGRKTASVFLAEFHKIPAIGVDTHVMRVARRFGFTTSKNPAIVERDLAKIFARENWKRYHQYMVLFGRYYCKARGPICNEIGVPVKHECEA